MTVLWPIAGKILLEPLTGTGSNNVSIVLLGSVGARRFLLAGDVEEAIDPSLPTATGLPARGLDPSQGGPLPRQLHGDDPGVRRSAVRPRVAIASPVMGKLRPGTLICCARSTGSSGSRRRHRSTRTDQDEPVSATFTRDGIRSARRRELCGAGETLAPTNRRRLPRRYRLRCHVSRPAPRSAAPSRSRPSFPSGNQFSLTRPEPRRPVTGTTRQTRAVPRPSGTIDRMTVPGWREAASCSPLIPRPGVRRRVTRAVAEVAASRRLIEAAINGAGSAPEEASRLCTT